MQYVCTSFPHPGISQVSTFHGLHASAAVLRPQTTHSSLPFGIGGVVCGRSTAADACSPWNVLTCDVPGCGNEVHTYCTLANPIEEFTCPKCEEKAQKKSLTKHPSLDARIAERRAQAGEEFKY